MKLKVIDEYTGSNEHPWRTSVGKFAFRLWESNYWNEDADAEVYQPRTWFDDGTPHTWKITDEINGDVFVVDSWEV